MDIPASSTALITDSTCDIPQALIDQYGISIVPMTVVWGETVLRDRVELSPEEFYRRLRSESKKPTSSQPSPEDFKKSYQEAMAHGAEEIVCLTISSAMSGTYSLAEEVGKQVDVPVHVVDSKGPTMSLGWQVLAAARCREAGGKALDMIAAAAKARLKMVQVVCLDTLEYLQRGGRIGMATRFIGSLLNLKPLVKINHKSGLVEASGQARTRKKSIEVLEERFFEEIDPDKPLHLAVLHGDAPEEAEQLADHIRKERAPKELLMNMTGPVLGIHTGPCALALCGYTEE